MSLETRVSQCYRHTDLHFTRYHPDIEEHLTDGTDDSQTGAGCQYDEHTAHVGEDQWLGIGTPCVIILIDTKKVIEIIRSVK